MANMQFSRLSSGFESNNLDVESNEASSRARNAKSRSLALEQAYVHDVYAFIAGSNPEAINSPVRSNVKNFIFDEFEPGSILLDVGCGEGKYLNLNPDVIVIGLDYCTEWFANHQHHCDHPLVVVGDGLHLPFHDDYFDGVICCGVLHHLSTRERRLKLLHELSRVVRVGGKLAITVTSNPAGRKTVGSQDVLIKIDTGCCRNRSDYSESDIESCSSSDSETSLDSIHNTELLTLPRAKNNIDHDATTLADFELDNCYSFVKKALKRLSVTSGLSTFRSSFNTSLGPIENVVKYRRGNRHNNDHNASDHNLFPIELHNLDDYECTSNLSSKSSSTTGDSALSSLNRSCSISQTSTHVTTNNMFPSSLMSVIRDHFNSWKVHLNANAVRHSFDSKPSNPECDTKRFQMFGFEADDSQPANHRFSLPVTFAKFTKPTESIESSGKNLLGKNKIYASNEENVPKFQNYLEQSEATSIDVNLEPGAKNSSSVRFEDKQVYSSSYSCRNLVLHKSFSLQVLSSSMVREDNGLGYFSLPDLSNVFRDSTNKDNLHSLARVMPGKRPPPMQSIKLDSQNASMLASPNADCSSTDEESKENPSELAGSKTQKCSKKLLRQRSFSADYPAETVKLQPEAPRRFSASPNIGTHRYNQNDHIPHQQQISMESEESFVTIIAAHGHENSDEGEDCDSLGEASPYSDSSDDDEACCENMSNEEKTSDDNSISSVLQATVRSAFNKCDSSETCLELESMNEEQAPIAYEEGNETPRSPPNSLHRYFHLFRAGELESLVEENIANLHIIDSYYNDYSMTWSVVAEKIHVWTI